MMILKGKHYRNAEKKYFAENMLPLFVGSNFEKMQKKRQNSEHKKMKKIEIRLWRDTMNIIKFCFIFIFPFVFTSCSIYPWKTIKFVSCPAEERPKMERSEIEDVDSDNVIENVFFYFVSNGMEETIYETKPPYSINFVFESFDKNTIITINSIIIELDGEKVFIEEGLLPLDITIDMHGYPNPELYWGRFKTNYVYNLQKVHEILVTVNATINSNGIEVTKDLKATAVKRVRRGIFQYRY